MIACRRMLRVCKMMHTVAEIDDRTALHIKDYTQRFHSLLYDQFVLSAACNLPFYEYKDDQISTILRFDDHGYNTHSVLRHFRPGPLFAHTTLSILFHTLGRYHGRRFPILHKPEHFSALISFCKNELQSLEPSTEIFAVDMFTKVDPLAKFASSDRDANRHVRRLLYLMNIHELFHMYGYALIRHSLIRLGAIRHPAHGRIIIECSSSKAACMEDTAIVLTELYNGQRSLYASDRDHFRSIYDRAYHLMLQPDFAPPGMFSLDFKTPKTNTATLENNEEQI